MAKRLRQSSIESAFKLRKGDSESETQPAIDSDTDENATDPEVIVDTEAELMTTSQAPVQDSEAEPSPSECNSPCCSSSKPCQPQSGSLAKMAKNGRNFLGKWFKSYTWLTICTNRKKAFCFSCQTATNKGLITMSTKADDAVSSTGFDNWKKALEKFRLHEQSDAHKEAITECKMLQTGVPVSSQLSSQLAKEQAQRRESFIVQLHCLR